MNQSVKQTLLLFVTGLIAIAVGSYFLITWKNQIKNDTEAAEATVVDYYEGTQTDATSDTTDIVYYPIVSYDIDGRTVQTQYAWGQSEKEYKIGQKVAIKYNPDDPDEFIFDGDRFVIWNYWEIPLGCILILIALARLITWLRLARRSSY